MASSKVEYEEIKEFYTIAKDIMNFQKDIFGGINIDGFVDNLRCYGIMNKDSDGSDPISVKGISDPVRLVCSCSYLVITYMNDWLLYTKEQKQALVLYALRRMPLEDNGDGKVLSPDYKDDGLMARTFGTDWLNRKLPDLTKDKVKWVI